MISVNVAVAAAAAAAAAAVCLRVINVAGSRSRFDLPLGPLLL